MDIAGNLLTDEQAVKAKAIYRQWIQLLGTTANPGQKFLFGDDLYKVVSTSSHVFSAVWVPGTGTESLYAKIDETHTGTINDPIPYNGNMELIEGLYYSQDGITYLCIQSTGQPVYHALSELMGIYVEVAV